MQKNEVIICVREMGIRNIIQGSYVFAAYKRIRLVQVFQDLKRKRRIMLKI
nr:MAG TPA: hypothetical protein [Bacteriophage sp.]